MRKIARFNAKKKFCANDLIPAYESYYKASSTNPDLGVAAPT
jgi:hypothetical protein